MNGAEQTVRIQAAIYQIWKEGKHSKPFTLQKTLHSLFFQSFRAAHLLLCIVPMFSNPLHNLTGTQSLVYISDRGINMKGTGSRDKIEIILTKINSSRSNKNIRDTVDLY